MSEFVFIRGQSLLKRSFVLNIFFLALLSVCLFCGLNCSIVFNSQGKSCLFIQVYEGRGANGNGMMSSFHATSFYELLLEAVCAGYHLTLIGFAF